MRTRTKLTLLVLAPLAVLLILVLPRLARWIDSRVEPKFAAAAALEMQYHDMTNAFRFAAELPPGHPTVELWRERREALLASGYLETRKIPMKKRPTGKSWSMDFFTRFAARWPGIERKVRHQEGEPTTVEVTARKGDFAAIQRFISDYESPK